MRWQYTACADRQGGGKISARAGSFIALSLLFMMVANPAAANLSTNDIFGTWRLSESGSVVEIYPCRQSVCMRIVKPADPSRRSSGDGAVRTRSRAGVVISDDLTLVRNNDGDLLWSGRIYDVSDGFSYTSKLKLVSATRATLAQCFLGPLFCKTQRLLRQVRTPPPASKQRNNRSVSVSRRTAIRPPMPEKRLPARDLALLRQKFEEFLDAETKSTSRTFQQDERKDLFVSFQAWLDELTEEERKKILERRE